jgi:hypothetical protein
MRYFRPPLAFNPTVPTGNFSDVLANPYNFSSMIGLGLLDASAANALMYKFTPFKSALTISNLTFIEVTYKDATTNALIFPYYSPFKWITVTYCSFFLR